MKYISVIVLLLIFGNHSLKAQFAPMMEMNIYFEDAAGNKDSVTLGYDPMATTNIDPAFGETVNNSPFDSVFEVRAGSFYFPYEEKLTDRLIQNAHFTGGCHSLSLASIYINAKYWPVKVSWDIDDYYTDCLSGSVILNHNVDILSGPIAPPDIPQEYACMAVEDHFYFELTEEAFSQSGIPLFMRPSIEWEVDGLGKKTIYGLRLMPERSPDGYTPCYWVTGTEDENRFTQLQISPNPAVDFLHLHFDPGQLNASVQIFDINGRCVKSERLEEGSNQLDISTLQKGVYLLLLQTETGQYQEKFIKA